MNDADRFAPPDEPQPGSKAYVYSADLKLAVRVALATARPLLLRGAPGCGKTTLAREVARHLGRVYYQQIVTSRTEARDLEWSFDAVRRLSDAQMGQAMNKEVRMAARYVEPRALWWSFDPGSAERRGSEGEPGAKEVVEDATDPGDYGDEPRDLARPTVTLIDEIDKAEPNVPNDLLEPFDVGGFTVAETRFTVKRKRPVLLVITTNEERDLPGAFLRRCVVFEIRRPDPDGCVKIAKSHFGSEVSETQMKGLAVRFSKLADEADRRGVRPPGVAEYLDSVRACRDLLIDEAHKDYLTITRLVLWKHREAPEDEADPTKGGA